MNQTIFLEKISFDGDASSVEKAAESISKGKEETNLVSKMETLGELLQVYEQTIKMAKTTKTYLKSDMKKMKTAAKEMEKMDQNLFLG